jgi:Dolichyl-phosphate-mannose-protein mannosyltransferase
MTATSEQAPARPAGRPPVTAPTVGATSAPASRRYLLLVLLALAAAFMLRGALSLTDDAPTTDETAYLRAGTAIWDGSGFQREGRPELHFPPGLPFALGGIEQLTGDAHEATVLLTLVTGTLLVLPLAALGRRIAGDGGGIAVAWCVALCPALTTLMTEKAQGSEAPYALLLSFGLWLALRVADASPRARAVGAALLGALTGVVYLIRPEGLFFGVLFLVVLALGASGGLEALRRRRLLAGAARSLALVVVAFSLALAAFVLPYASFLHENTGRWELTAKAQDASLAAWRAVALGDRRARDEVLYALDDSGVAFRAGRSTLPQLVRSDPVGYLAIVKINLQSIASDLLVPEWRKVPPLGVVLPVWLLIPGPLVALAGWAAWRNRRRREMVATVVAIALPLSTALLFFNQPRYLIGAAALVCVPLGVGFVQLPRRWLVPAVVAAVVLVVVSTVPTLRGPGGWFRPREHNDQQVAGEWLARHTAPDDRVMTRSMVVEYYAQREAVPIPYGDYDAALAFARHFDVQYLVADRHQLRRLRPELRGLFRRTDPPGLRLVFADEVEGSPVRIFAVLPDAATPAADRRVRAPHLGFTGDSR